MAKRLAVVADDLTGAMDTGLQFGKCGMDTVVSLSWDHLPQAQVVVLDTNSRAIRASAARNRLRRVGEMVAGYRLYKKVDSTMRGNVGYELRGLADALHPRAFVVAPAFPGGGRTTLRGRQRVHGKPLELTYFARDPRWPMLDSHLPTLLMRQFGGEVGEVPLEVVSEGPDAVARALVACQQRVIVTDALDQRHLRAIAAAVVSLGEGWIPCGSAGLAEEWVAELDLEPTVQQIPSCEAGARVLIVSGSRNDQTLRQLEVAQNELGLGRVDLDPYQTYDADREAARLARECQSLLDQGRDVILTASFSPMVAGGGDLVARVLAAAASRLAKDVSLNGIFVTGGDVAVALCRALGVKGLRIAQEVQPGIPGGQMLGGSLDACRIVTKAGGFGDQRALVDALSYLRGQPISTTRPR